MRRPLTAWVAWLDRTEPVHWWENAEALLWWQSNDSEDVDDRMEPADANDQMLPTDATDPMLPMDRTESWEQTDRIEFSDRMDHMSAAYAGGRLADDVLALLGERTRPRSDLDLVVVRADVPAVTAHLLAQGFEVLRHWLRMRAGYELRPMDVADLRRLRDRFG